LAVTGQLGFKRGNLLILGLDLDLLSHLCHFVVILDRLFVLVRQFCRQLLLLLVYP
jgi:hypothetical protein